VFFGKLFSYLPERVVHLASGFLFLIFAILALRRENDEDANGTNRRPRSFIEAYRLAFIAVFIAEWGDLTQLATVTLVARTQEIWTIFLSSLAALWSATAIGCYAGHHLGRRIPLRPLQILSAALFAVVGVWMIVSA
ncbi:MAG: TMEM165/GDT1 family protein, partial [Bdellovibrionota bacterium]